MKILGIHHSGPIASAALVVDGRVVAGAPQERFSRVKQDDKFPHDAIRFCLSRAGIGLTDLDAVAIGWNPGENAALKYHRGFSDWMRYPGEWLASVPNHLLSKLGQGVTGSSSEFDLAGGGRFAIRFVDHHTAHARLAEAAAGFAECAICVIDGWSEQKVTTVYRLRSGALETIYSKAFPHSIGGFYATMTEFLGYRPFADEWRMMGMAAYGDASRVASMDRLIHLLDDGDYELDLSYYDFYNFDRAGYFTAKLESLLGPARRRGDALEQRHYDVAAAAQAQFERVMVHVLRAAHAATGCDDLALAGGVAMNCLFNGRVLETTPFRRCRISFAPDDSGNSIGAALAVAAESGALPVQELVSAIGPEFGDDEIGEALERWKLRARKVSDPAEAAAPLLLEDKVVGWMQGRSEFGQRALGHRSIFASPLRAEMKDRINASIKYRESYRPFAPMLPEEAVHLYFDAAAGGPVRFMEKAFRFRPGMDRAVPAVVHQDGTGRLQTVGEDEPLLRRLLAEFARGSGHPVLVNTSFNLNGEPMVLAPEDAIRTFATSGIDALVIGRYVLEKGAL
jgi:carbamoyltransferase